MLMCIIIAIVAFGLGVGFADKVKLMYNKIKDKVVKKDDGSVK